MEYMFHFKYFIRIEYFLVSTSFINMIKTTFAIGIIMVLQYYNFSSFQKNLTNILKLEECETLKLYQISITSIF